MPYFRKNGRPAGAKYQEHHCVRLDDILHEGLDFSFLTSQDGANTCRRHKVRSKRELAKRLALDFLDMMIQDLIQEGDVYKLPIQQGAFMYVVRKTDRAIESIAKRGTYKKVDLFDADFNIYELVLDFYVAYKLRRRILHLDKARYTQLAELVNNGKRYLRGFT
jgi:hypothetical protein